MTLGEILSAERIVASRAASKPAVLAELARLAAPALGLTPAAIAQALVAREGLGSTGIGGGLAMPHARMAGLAAPMAFLARLERVVEWGAIDGKPADLVFLLLSPEREDAGHLAALAAMTRRLREPGVAGAVREARDSDAAWRIIATAPSGR